MSTTHVPARLIPESRALAAGQFQGLSDVPPELEWLANIPNEKTRRAYQLDITDFSAFVGIQRPEEFRLITRAHVIAWRKDFKRRRLAPSTVRRKLSALSSLWLCQLSRHQDEIGNVDHSDLGYAAAIMSINWANRS
jgi:hypothetical protein